MKAYYLTEIALSTKQVRSQYDEEQITKAVLSLVIKGTAKTCDSESQQLQQLLSDEHRQHHNLRSNLYSKYREKRYERVAL